jgi:hypothetical protein
MLHSAVSSSLPAAVAFLAALAAAPAGSAAEPSRPDDRMLLLWPAGGAAADLASLEQALEAHLRPYAIDVSPLPTATVPADAAGREALAASLLRTHGAGAAVWIDVARRNVTLVHVDSAGATSSLERRFDCVSKSLGECGDAIASVVSSAVSSWIGPPPATAEPGAGAAYAEDNELSPLRIDKPPWRAPDPLVRLSLLVGYGVAPIRGSVRAAHGFELGAAAIAARYALLEVAVDPYWPIVGDSSASAAWIEIARVGLGVRAGGALPLGRFLLALSAGLALDFARVVETSPQAESAAADETRVGFSAALSLRLRLFEPLSLWASAGLDAFGADLVYRGSEPGGEVATLVRCGALQGRLLLGAEVDFGLGRITPPRASRR